MAQRTVKCAVCPAVFTTNNPTKNTCSDECAEIRHKQKMREWYEKNGKQYYAARRRSDDLPSFYRDPVPGVVTCPYCQEKWNSPDKCYIKYHRACRTAALGKGYQAEEYGALHLP